MTTADDIKFGTGFLFQDGDIVMSQAHEIELVSGSQNAIQGLEILMTTIRGENLFNIDFGLDVMALYTNIGHLNKKEREQYYKLLVSQALLSDDRVQTVLDITASLDQSTRTLNSDVVVKFFNNNEIRLNNQANI